MNIDIKLLKKQKRTLIELRDYYDKRAKRLGSGGSKAGRLYLRYAEHLSGCIHLIDALEEANAEVTSRPPRAID